MSARSIGGFCFGAALLGAAPAAAQVPSFNPAEDGRAPESARPVVPLTIDAEGAARIVSGAGTAHCGAPCTVEVPAGFVRIHVGALSQEVFVDRPSRVRMSPGAPAVRSAGLVVLLAGLAVVVAAVAIPLYVCRGQTVTDSFGRTRSDNPCRDFSDGVKAGWIAGGGIGLTAAIVGAITFGTSGPRLQVTPMRSGAALAPHLSFTTVF